MLFDLALYLALQSKHTERARRAGNAIAHLFTRKAPLPKDVVERLIRTIADWTPRKEQK